jgi:hypothetical protein
MGVYKTVAAPTLTAGFLVQPESRIMMGTVALYGSLEVASWTYATYEASIGLQAGTSFDIGLVDSLGFTHEPSIEPLESANVADASIYLVTGEETALDVGVQQFDTRTLEVAMATGTMYTLGDEKLITFGGGCSVKNRPIAIESGNVACDAPTSPNVANGVTAIVLTLYDCICTSGLPWDAMVAGEISVLDLTFEARPVLARAKGNRLGCIYVY